MSYAAALTLLYLSGTDGTVLGRIGCKSLYDALGMEIDYGCSSRDANPKQMFCDSRSCGVSNVTIHKWVGVASLWSAWLQVFGPGSKSR